MRGLRYSTAVIRLIVPIYQSLQDVQILQGIRLGDITIKPIFQGTVESFCHAGFGISSGLKGVECLYLSQILKSAIEKILCYHPSEGFGVSVLLAHFTIKDIHDD